MALDDPTADPTTDPLARALEAARTEQPEHWVELSSAIKRRVREVVTPAYALLVLLERRWAFWHPSVRSK